MKILNIKEYNKQPFFSKVFNDANFSFLILPIVKNYKNYNKPLLKYYLKNRYWKQLLNKFNKKMVLIILTENIVSSHCTTNGNFIGINTETHKLLKNIKIKD